MYRLRIFRAKRSKREKFSAEYPALFWLASSLKAISSTQCNWFSSQFAGFTGVMEKTDKKDAQVLEDYGRLFHMKATFLAIITPKMRPCLLNNRMI